MKRLIYVPIIHTAADLGSLAKDVVRRGISDLGENLWEEHKKTVDEFWDAISTYFSSIDVSGAKIYQDGMVAEGEVGAKIVEEGVKLESKNYELVSRLIRRGAILVKTEDFKFVKEERDRLLAITGAKSTFQKLAAFIKYKLTKDKLLSKRDEFIVRSINETLSHGERGILFLGAYHDIKNNLPKSFVITEVKDIEKVREYQKLLPFYKKNRKRFNELGEYLVSPITETGGK